MMMSGYGMHVVGFLLNVALVLGLWALSVAVIIATLRACSGRPQAGPEQDAGRRDPVRSGR